MQEGIVSAGEDKYPVNGRLTIGRTPDNTVSFPGDEKISRNHAYVEQREDAFYIVDLGSSNGSKLNGIPFTGEHQLQSGDYAILGNSSVVVFTIKEEDQPEESEESGDESEAAAVPEATPEEKKKNRAMLAGAGGALVLAMAIGG